VILRILNNAPEKAVPVAMALLVTGLSLLTIGITWPPHLALLQGAGDDWNDFLRGAFFGLAITLEIFGVVLAASAAAQKKRNSA